MTLSGLWKDPVVAFFLPLFYGCWSFFFLESESVVGDPRLSLTSLPFGRPCQNHPREVSDLSDVHLVLPPLLNLVTGAGENRSAKTCYSVTSRSLLAR